MAEVRYIHMSDRRTAELRPLKYLLGRLELVSKELNHFGMIAGLFRQIGSQSSTRSIRL